MQNRLLLAVSALALGLIMAAPAFAQPNADNGSGAADNGSAAAGAGGDQALGSTQVNDNAIAADDQQNLNGGDVAGDNLNDGNTAGGDLAGDDLNQENGNTEAESESAAAGDNNNGDLAGDDQQNYNTAGNDFAGGDQENGNIEAEEGGVAAGGDANSAEEGGTIAGGDANSAEEGGTIAGGDANEAEEGGTIAGNDAAGDDQTNGNTAGGDLAGDDQSNNNTTTTNVAVSVDVLVATVSGITVGNVNNDNNGNLQITTGNIDTHSGAAFAGISTQSNNTGIGAANQAATSLAANANISFGAP